VIRLSSLLKEGSKKIGAADALWLLESLLSLKKSEILLNPELKISPAKQKKFKLWTARCKKGEPLQYIAGEAPFWGRTFAVAPGVLIPRPETEHLVEIAMREGDSIAQEGKLSVFDVGLGSGCIAVTLASERPAWDVSGSESSRDAIRICRKNDKKFNTRVNIFLEYFLNPVLAKKTVTPDLVVSNPPYLDFEKDKIQKSVLRWEPHEALHSQYSGAWHAEQIFAQCLFFKPKRLVLELSPRVALRLQKKWQKNNAVKRIWREADLAGRSRFLLIEFTNG
jgi:release factor glutamine methyltransferase